MSEKPIHVQVAEALGWSDFEHRRAPQNVGQIADSANFPPVGHEYEWAGWGEIERARDPKALNHRKGNCVYAYDGEPCECHPPHKRKVPRFDLDWAVTGPLVERYKINVENVDMQPLTWMAEGWLGNTAHAETPLLAICHLIIALSKEGKLSK